MGVASTLVRKAVSAARQAAQSVAIDGLPRRSGEGQITPFCARARARARAARLLVANSAFQASRIASMRICATSGRLNSGGGSCPARKSSRTLVPEREICVLASPGAVFAVPIDAT